MEEKRQAEKYELDGDDSSILFWKLETLRGSYSPPFLLADIFKELAKELVKSSSRCVHHIKISIDLLFVKPFKLFPLVFRVFHNVWRPSAAMKSSGSRIECSLRGARLSPFRRLSSFKISKKPSRKTEIFASEFCSFSSSTHFCLKSLSNLPQETFWRSKQNFEVSGPYSEIRTNPSALTNWEI